MALTDDFLFYKVFRTSWVFNDFNRWHIDDPAGRLQDKYPKNKSYYYKAIAEENEEHRKIGKHFSQNISQ